MAADLNVAFYADTVNALALVDLRTMSNMLRGVAKPERIRQKTSSAPPVTSQRSKAWRSIMISVFAFTSIGAR